MKKKLLSILLVLSFIAAAIPSIASAASVNVSINEKLVQFTDNSGYPFIDSSFRTQVPLRAAMEAFGAQVDWNGSTQTATVSMSGTTVEVPIGQSYIAVNGQRVYIDTASQIIANRTFLPIRAVLEAFGAHVDWNGVTQTVFVSTVGSTLDTSYYSEYASLLYDILANPSKYYENAGMPLEYNEYTLADITGDGIDELIVRFTGTYMAAQYAAIYSYSEETNSVYKLGELGAHCSRFFDNGTVMEDDSHNQTYGFSIWPYRIVRYDGNKFTYFAHAYCLDADYEYSYTPFPYSEDKDGDGVVYLIEYGSNYPFESSSGYLTLDEYRSTVADLVGYDAAEIQTTTYSLTYDNISKLF